jgi:hypothetical protein
VKNNFDFLVGTWTSTQRRLREVLSDSDEWSIYWAATLQGLGLPPQVGRFGDDGRGIFLSDDVYQGRPVQVAYIWSDITGDSARWEQAAWSDSTSR